MSNYNVYFNDYLKDLKQRKLDEDTIRNYRSDLKQYFSFKAKSDNETEVVKEYLAYLCDHYDKMRTIKRKVAVLRAFYSYLASNDIIAVSPFDKIHLKLKEEKILPKTIRHDNLRSIINYQYHQSHKAANRKKHRMMIRNTCMIEMMICTGIRVSELCNIKLSDIDFREGMIRINGKGAKERVVYIGIDVMQNILNEYCYLYRDKLANDGYLFLNRFDQRLHEQSVRLILKGIETSLFLDQHITPHMIRHTFATGLLEHDIDIRYIQRILGHSSITTTQIYTHVSSNKQKEIMTRFNPRHDY